MFLGGGGAAQFGVSAPASTTPNASFNVTVTAEDANGNKFSSYTGTVTFYSSDPFAVLPANGTLTSGVGTFAVTLISGGPQTITAADSALSGLTGTATVSDNSTLLWYDTFAGPAGQTPLNHTPNFSVGGGSYPATNGFTIGGGTLTATVSSGSTNAALTPFNLGTSNATVNVTVSTTVVNSQIYIYLLYVNGNNWARLYMSNGAIGIQEYLSGSLHTRATGSVSMSPNTPYAVSFQANSASGYTAKVGSTTLTYATINSALANATGSGIEIDWTSGGAVTTTFSNLIATSP
jgi:hypothetical protein